MWPTFYIPSANSFPSLEPVTVGNLGCNTWEIVFTPASQLSGASAGDLCVLVVQGDLQSSTANFVTVSPDTFSRYLWSSMDGSYLRVYGSNKTAVLYKFLTEADLTTSFTITHSGGNHPDNEICARGYVFRNANEDVPLDCFSFFASGSAITAVNGYRFVGISSSVMSNKPADFQMSLLCYRNTDNIENAPLPATIERLSPSLYDEWNSTLPRQGLGAAECVNVTLRLTAPALENLFSAETVGNPLTGWTNGNLDVANTGLGALGTRERYAYLRANNVTGRHYVEKEVYLTAGEKFSFHVGARRRTSVASSVGIGVVAPSGDEIAFTSQQEFSSNGSPVLDSASPYIDGTSSREVDWWGGVPYVYWGGVPNTYTLPMSLLFTAKETGNHKFRIYVGSGTSAASLTHADNTKTAEIYWASLYAGHCSPMWTPGTPTGVFARQQAGPIYYESEASASKLGSAGLGQYSFIIASKGPLEKAVLSPFFGYCAASPAIDDDGLTVGAPTTLDNGRASPAICSRQVYPTISGSAAKYYAEIEITSLSGTDSRHGIYVGPLHATFRDGANNLGHGVYGWDQTGALYAGSSSSVATSAWGATAGTILGVLVDYTDNTVKFYKDGSLIQTLNMNLSAGIEHQKLPFALLIYNAISETTYFDYVANLTGPFGGRKPSGAVAWDYWNEVS